MFKGLQESFEVRLFPYLVSQFRPGVHTLPETVVLPHHFRPVPYHKGHTRRLLEVLQLPVDPVVLVSVVVLLLEISRHEDLRRSYFVTKLILTYRLLVPLVTVLLGVTVDPPFLVSPLTEQYHWCILEQL